MPTEEIQKLTFKKLIMTVGNLPSSYVESLSYYECMLWLCNYLENTVIPAVNNNGEAVEELQSLFVQLKNYVDEYFTDLNVQTQINNKLDEMVEDGTMDTIINQEIFGELNDNIETYESDYVVAIGDSYSINNGGWGASLCSALHKVNNVSFFLKGEGASGLTATGHNGHKFIDLLELAGESITEPAKVKKVIMMGFYNDRNAQSSDIATAFTAFKARMLELFPNATLYVGCIAGNNGLTASDATDRQKLVANCEVMKNLCLYNQAIYLTNSEIVLKNYTLYDNTNYHPSSQGCIDIADMVVQNLNGSSFKFPYAKSLVTVTDARGVTTSITSNMAYESINENIYQLIGRQEINYTEGQSIAVNSGAYLGTINQQKYLRPNKELYHQRIPATAQVTTTADQSYAIGGYMTVSDTGEWLFYPNRAYTIKYINIFFTGVIPAQYV